MRKRPDRARIKEDWIESVIEKPEKVEIQSDCRIRTTGENIRNRKILEGYPLEDGKTVHNAFFDR